ncbi:hypothetical protein B0H19DRAFT_1277608 [Mycena capillaripes]|nr:hypothetical protein B0H19DRAFT_1277608 [Mycena capillaripes]
MPPRIDPNALPPLDQIQGSSVNALKKPELLSVAKALSLELPANPNSINNKELKSQVSKALASQKFANDTRFHKFAVHRPGTTGGAALKNSVDKDKQDLKAAQNQDVAPTGAHKKLLQQDVKSDPAPQFKYLKGPDYDVNNDKKPAEDSDSSLSSPPLSEKGEDKPNKPSSKLPVDPPPSYTLVEPDEDEAKLPIAVEFQGKDTRTIWISPSQRETIPLFKAADGTITTSLKRLVPVALSQLSPAKGDRYAKLSLVTDRGTLSLGTAHEFMSGNFPEFLKLAQADTCKLDQKPDRLLCYFLWRPGKPPSVDQESSGTIKPLDLAKARKAAAPKRKKRFVPAGASDEEQDWPNNETDVPFLKFLNPLVGGRPNGYPVSLETIDKRLERWNDRLTAIEYCEENYATGRHGKPYQCKDDENEAYHQYANRPFTKKCITLALGIGNGTVTADKKLFTSLDIPYDPLAEMWVNGDIKLDAKAKANFDKMKSSEWVAHLKKAKEEKLSAQAKEERRAKEKAKKRKYESDSDSSVVVDSEEERRLKRKLKRLQAAKKEAVDGDDSDHEEAGSSRFKKSEAKPRYDSNNLD